MNNVTDVFSSEAYALTRAALWSTAADIAASQGHDLGSALSPETGEHNVLRQYFTILALGLFDTEFYLAQNPDLKNLDIDCLAHYIEYGDREGRWPNAVFDPASYRRQFKPGELGSISSLYHYALLGEVLGLKTGGGFDPLRYLSSHSELIDWVDRPLLHYLHLGRAAGFSLSHRMRLPSDKKVELKKPDVQVTASVPDLSKGLNIIGPLDKVSGLGVSARGYLQGIRSAGFSQIGCHTRQMEFPRQTSLQELDLPRAVPDARVNLVHMNGDTFPMMMDNDGPGLLFGKYNIGIWYWELSALRPEWYGSLQYFDEFWAPTEFIARTLRGATSKPVTVIPPYLPQLVSEDPVDHAGRSNYFLYCFDANSILERKNPVALLEAFRRAFPQGDTPHDVRLIFKVTYPDRSIPDVEALYQASIEDSRIEVIDELLGKEALHALISHALAYVSPHRSEGLGLTVIEAMGCGVPAITTQYGGLLEFIDADSAFPVEFSLLEIETEAFPYPAGYVWCDPSIESMAKHMRFVQENAGAARLKGAAGRRRIMDRLCSDQLINDYRQQIGRLSTQN